MNIFYFPRMSERLTYEIAPPPHLLVIYIHVYIMYICGIGVLNNFVCK